MNSSAVLQHIGLERAIVQVFAGCGIAKLRELVFAKDFWEDDGANDHKQTNYTGKEDGSRRILLEIPQPREARNLDQCEHGHSLSSKFLNRMIIP